LNLKETAVHHIHLDSQNEAVKRFFLSLPVDPQGSVVELNGQAVACVVPMPSSNGGADAEWTDAKNNRRCDLIDKEYARTITAEEAVELHALQEEMYRFVDRVAPLPLEDARRLHQDLLRKSMESATP
jgi:hypothetical protein